MVKSHSTLFLITQSYRHMSCLSMCSGRDVRSDFPQILKKESQTVVGEPVWTHVGPERPVASDNFNEL